MVLKKVLIEQQSNDLTGFLPGGLVAGRITTDVDMVTEELLAQGLQFKIIGVEFNRLSLSSISWSFWITRLA